MKRCIALMCAATIVLGCSPSGSPPSPESASAPAAAESATPADELAAVSGRTWKLDSLGEASAVPVEGTEITLSFREEGGMAGSSGCNRYQAALEVSPDGRLSVGPIAATRMACPEPVMDQEDRYLARLGAITGYEIEDERLTLTDDEGGRLTFVSTAESAP